MSPSAIPVQAELGAPGETVVAAANGSAAALSSKQEQQQQQYASGDPSLAAMDEEVEMAPRFDDPYEERQYLKHRLAIAFRIFAQLDLAESIAGHITLRDPVDPSSFWVNPFGWFLSFRSPWSHASSLWKFLAISNSSGWFGDLV